MINYRKNKPICRAVKNHSKRGEITNYKYVCTACAPYNPTQKVKKSFELRDSDNASITKCKRTTKKTKTNYYKPKPPETDYEQLRTRNAERTPREATEFIIKNTKAYENRFKINEKRVNKKTTAGKREMK